MSKVIIINEADNVAIAVHELKKGETIVETAEKLELLDDIPMGHKIAIRDIKAGENILRYGNPISHATRDIARGEWVHVHNTFTNLADIIEYQYNPSLPTPKQYDKIPTFMGYSRPDHQVGIRNEIWIITASHCANGPAQKIAELANLKYPRTSNFDGFYAYTHPYGCSQMGEDLLNTQKILANLTNHPNAGGVLIVANGCEVNCLDSFLPVLGEYNPDRVKLLNYQDVEDEISVGMEYIDQLYNYAAQFHRQEIPVSELVIAVNCGGSDAFSGITANALLGHITNIITDMGGTIVMTEVPEMFGAEHLLMNRAASKEVYDKIVKMINDYKNYYKEHDQVIYDNPTQGNLAGGLSTLEEKSLGCTQKGGTAIVTDVLEYGQRVKQKGFNLISGPGNDVVGITNQEAAGCVLTIFTTGRGTPAGYTTPLLRLASNSDVARRKNNWIDYNAGVILEGKSFKEATEELMSLIIDVASGCKQTRSEAQGYRQIGILKQGVIN